MIAIAEISGADSVAAGALYRGLAAAIGLDALGSAGTHDPATDLEQDLGRAFLGAGRYTRVLCLGTLDEAAIPGLDAPEP